MRDQLRLRSPWHLLSVTETIIVGTALFLIVELFAVLKARGIANNDNIVTLIGGIIGVVLSIYGAHKINRLSAQREQFYARKELYSIIWEMETSAQWTRGSLALSASGRRTKAMEETGSVAMRRFFHSLDALSTVPITAYVGDTELAAEVRILKESAARMKALIDRIGANITDPEKTSLLLQQIRYLCTDTIDVRYVLLYGGTAEHLKEKVGARDALSPFDPRRWRPQYWRLPSLDDINEAEEL